MSEQDITRLDRKLEEINIKLERMDQKFESYPDLVKKVESVEKAQNEQAIRCNYVQASKTKISWGQVIQTIVSAISISVIIWFVTEVMK